MKILLFILLQCSRVHAGSFYTKSDLQVINNDKISNYELKQNLQSIAKHGQKEITYKDARWHLYTDIYLNETEDGHYYIQDRYCQKRFFKNTGPDQMPYGTKTNIEHTWPQSKFSNAFRKELQKSDLHHLFIVNKNANHLRGNIHFGEVQGFIPRKGTCSNAGLGILVKTPQNVAWSSNDYYQPPKSHRGDVARALFYFATRYNLRINDTQEYFLRKWHKEDPVTDIDKERNTRIMKIQGNRNPFIDHPKLVDRIKNF
jgi:deoxyribonuclease-1